MIFQDPIGDAYQIPISVAIDVAVVCREAAGEDAAKPIFLKHGIPSTVAARLLFHAQERRPTESERAKVEAAPPSKNIVKILLKGTLMHSQKLLVAAFAFYAAAAVASPVNTVNWTGSDNFDSETIFFGPFQASELSSITGTGIAHNHGYINDFQVRLLIHLDGAWQKIAEATMEDMTGRNYSLADLFAGPIKFSSGTVDGLWLQPQFNQYVTFHSLTSDGYGNPGGTRFEFTYGQSSSVPEPGSLAALGIGLIALVASYKLQRKA